MKRIAFNDNWTCRHVQDAGEGRAVTIPHDAMLEEKRTPDSPGGINIGWFEGYDYVYEKAFHVPLEYKELNAVFEFEGVYKNAEVYLNGSKAGFRPYGYTNFYVEADSFLKYGEKNKIRVIAHNADQPNSRWYSGAGIYRPVTLLLMPKEHILLNGIKLRTVSIHPAKLEVSVRTNAPGLVSVQIFEKDRAEGDGALNASNAPITPIASNTSNTPIPPIVQAQKETKGEITMLLEIPNAKLWSPDTPFLYECRVRFGEEEVSETFGIRTIGWSRENGFTMNGERVILRGACIHHDNGVLGACCYPEAEERKIRILKENGYNAVRSAHNPCSKALLEACDRLGMMVMDEFVDVWYIHKTEYDYVNDFMHWWQQDLRDMVEKDYNHPSVIMYSTGNEVSETAQKRGIELTGKLTEYLHSLDATRPVTCGINIFFNFLSSIGFGVYSDKKAKKEAERPGGKKKAVGSEFFNNLAGLLGSRTMKIGATLHGCDVKTRDAFANMDIAGYNYGIFRYRHDLKKYPDRLILGSETFCDDAYDFWEMAKKNPGIIGDFVWAGMDYLGEVGVGSWEYSDYAPDFSHGPGWITAGSGRIDLTGKPLAEAAYTRTAFELNEKPVIAVRPVNHTDDRHSPSAWKMTNAVESWSWEGCEGKKAVIEVYARAARVEISINGKPAGSKRLKNTCRAVFTAEYQKGRIEAKAYDEAGRRISESVLCTAEKETQLHAIPEEKEVEPGKLCFIRLKYADRNGVVKPLKRGILHVEVENGELKGLGNGCPYNEIGYKENRTDTYFGEALAVVRADGKGPVILHVSDKELRCSVKIPVTERVAKKVNKKVTEKVAE